MPPGYPTRSRTFACPCSIKSKYREKQKEVPMFQKKRTRLLVLAALALILSTLACGEEVSPTLVGQVTTEPSGDEQPVATKEPDATEAPAEEPTQPAPTNYQVGDIISMGDVVMVVLGWENPAGDDFSKPDEGNVFVAVELILVNQSDSSISVSSMLQMELKDDTHQRYDVDFTASMAIEESSPDGEISPGERVRGKVGFQVPEDAAGLVFVFDADVWGTGKVFVELGPEPVSVEPPAELPGEKAQTMYAIGDVIEIGDLTLSVNEVTYPSGDSFNKPDEGYKFVVVDVTIKNKSSEAVSVSSMLQMSLKDDAGQGYDVDLMASAASGGSTPDGEIAPGETIRGQVGFEVPDDTTGLVFVFDADVWGFGKVFVALS
jgi:hypothetical protein